MIVPSVALKSHRKSWWPKPSDDHLSKLLDAAAGAPIASPLSGVILSPLPEPDAEEELEDGVGGNAHVGGRVRAPKMRPGLGLGPDKKIRKKVGNGRTKSRFSKPAETVDEIDAAISKARDAQSAGSYEEEMQHGQGAVTSVYAGVRVGVGLGLYHKFAQGVMLGLFFSFLWSFRAIIYVHFAALWVSFLERRFIAFMGSKRPMIEPCTNIFSGRLLLAVIRVGESGRLRRAERLRTVGH